MTVASIKRVHFPCAGEVEGTRAAREEQGRSDQTAGGAQDRALSAPSAQGHWRRRLETLQDVSMCVSISVAYMLYVSLSIPYQTDFFYLSFCMQ